MAHSELSPSAAARWMYCPGSVALCRGIPSEQTDYAREGTLAHALAAAMVTGAPTDEIAADIEREGFDVDEMTGNARMYADYVLSLGGTVEIEQRVDLSNVLTPGAYGTADAVVWVGKTLHIIDLKYGMRRVNAFCNAQLTLYAEGFYRLYGQIDSIDEIVLTIIQPRLNSIDTYTTDPARVGAISHNIAAMGKRALKMADGPDDDIECNPSADACRYCRARATCRALADYVNNWTENDAPALTVDKLADAYKRLDIVKIWAEGVEKAVYSRLLNGDPVPGLKLVEGRKGARKWDDEAAVEAAAVAGGANPYDRPKILSPAKMEKLVKSGDLDAGLWQDLATHITQNPTKPTIADKLDKRAEFVPQNSINFPNCEE